MNLTSNKTVRIIICFTIMVAVCIGMTFLPQNDDKTLVSEQTYKLQLVDADQVCVSGALYESWMYILTDKYFLEKAIAVLEDLDYEITDKAVNMTESEKTLSLTFSKGNEQIKKIIIDSNNLLCFEAGTQSYRITSDFDFDTFYSMVQAEIEKVKSDIVSASKADE